MRVLILLLAASLAGCLAQPLDEPCKPQEVALWFGPGMSLLPAKPGAQGSVTGNGFQAAFLTNDMKEWWSEPLGSFAIQDNITLEFWAENVGTPAPVMVGGDPGEGYHFFNQFGSNRGFQPGYAIEYNDAAPIPGSVDHYVETITMPPGGFFVEPGDQLRVLLTSLVLDQAPSNEGEGGHNILFGGSTPSHIRFIAHCWTAPTLTDASTETPVALTGNQGLLTGAVPRQEGVNVAYVPFTLDAATARLTIEIIADDASGPKQDLDLTLTTPEGEEFWSIGSPYTDELGTLWQANLDAVMPPGDYVVRVDSYSGSAYTGTVVVTQSQP